MEALADLSWRVYPSAALLAFGASAIGYGGVRLATSLRLSAWDSTRNIAFAGGLRAAIVGLAVVALGASWLWQQLWLFVLALVFGGEELLETTAILFALRRARRLEKRSTAGVQ